MLLFKQTQEISNDQLLQTTENKICLAYHAVKKLFKEKAVVSCYSIEKHVQIKFYTGKAVSLAKGRGSVSNVIVKN